MRGRGRSAEFGTRRMHELHVMRRRRFSQHITYVLCRVPESRWDPDLGSAAQRGGVLTSFSRSTVLSEDDLLPSHYHASMTAEERCHCST